MITIGGLDNIKATDYCDWEYMSVGVYDMTEGTVNGWGSVFSADKAPYQVNDQVVAAIGGGPDGNATKLLPDGGWSTTLVANLFTGTNNQTQPVNIGSTTPAPSAKSKNIKTAAIIGGTIGGVGGIAILALLSWLCVRRYPAFFKKSEAGGQEQLERERADMLGKSELDSQRLSEAIKPGELPPGIHRVMTEVSGTTARSELAANRFLVEMGAPEVHELS